MFTEGEQTEVQYLLHWYRLHRHQVIVTIDRFHAGPLQLVERAIARREEVLRIEKRGRGRAPTQIWCVFDVDEHPDMPRALQLAAAHGIELAVSNPCLELWFLLHFRDQAAWITGSTAQAAAATFLSGGKTLTPTDLDVLYERHEIAKARAQRLSATHVGDGNRAGENPSSGVWRLLDNVRGSDDRIAR